jgi:two-component system OmpR family sensor kinase
VIARIPIRWRLALAFAGAMAVLLLGAGLFLRFSLAEELEDGVEESLRTRSDEIAALVARTGGDSLGDPGPVRVSDAEESAAQLLDAGGRVLDASSPLLGESLLDDDALGRARRGAVFVDVASVPGVAGRARLLARPVDTPGGGRIVVVGGSLESRDEAVAGLVPLLLVLGPVALLLASALGYAVAAAALAPVEALRAGAKEISGTSPGARLVVPAARDELRDLGETLNAMLERIDDALRRERDFVADAGHELRTPIAILKAEIDLALMGDRPAGELRAALVSAAEETTRLAHLSDDLLDLARSEQGAGTLRPEAVGAREMLDGVARRFGARAADAGRGIEVRAPEGLRLTVDRGRIEGALGNLVDNSLRHGRGPIRLEASRGEDGSHLSVSDGGSFDPAFAPRAFERFSRPDPGRAGGGAGLGLAIVRANARMHGGDAEISVSPAGSRVTIHLP